MTRPTKNGFIDVHHHGVATPLGWGPLGDSHLQNFSAFLKSIHPRIRDSLYPQDKSLVNVIIDKATTECTTFQSHVNWFVCYCQKPQDPILDVTAEAMMYKTDSLSSSMGSEGYLESISDFSDGYID
jgi:hypothetical protein